MGFAWTALNQLIARSSAGSFDAKLNNMETLLEKLKLAFAHQSIVEGLPIKAEHTDRLAEIAYRLSNEYNANTVLCKPEGSDSAKGAAVASGTAIPMRFKEDFTEHDSNTVLAASWNYQLCPKCFGEGTIHYYPKDTTGLNWKTCPVCNGAKTLRVPNCQPACAHAKGW